VMWVTVSGPNGFSYYPSKRDYPTLKECVAHRAADLAEYQTFSSGEGAFAAGCALYSGSYRVFLFLER
jgi:hypothetical protein